MPDPVQAVVNQLTSQAYIQFGANGQPQDMKVCAQTGGMDKCNVSDNTAVTWNSRTCNAPGRPPKPLLGYRLLQHLVFGPGSMQPHA